jgi:surface protein
MPDLRNIVTGYFGDVIFSQFSQAQDEVNKARDKVTFATAEEFRKSKATDCIFINFKIISNDHTNNPDIPETLLNCSGVPKIKTHTLAWMFRGSQFNGDISKWDVSNVTNTEGMFTDSKFNNSSLNTWDVSSVTDMYAMFGYSQFNGDISQWDVSSVTNMYGMFQYSQFNGDISQWDVSLVTDATLMFWNSQFNSDLSQWDVSSVEKMFGMFMYSKFNGDLSQWDVSNVTNMEAVFNGSEFNGDISQWDNFKKYS